MREIRTTSMKGRGEFMKLIHDEYHMNLPSYTDRNKRQKRSQKRKLPKQQQEEESTK